MRQTTAPYLSIDRTKAKYKERRQGGDLKSLCNKFQNFKGSVYYHLKVLTKA